MAADIFLNSVDGNDVDDGSTWALAKATLQTGIAAIDVTDQRVLIDSNHTETASSISYTSPGTAAAPCQLLSVTQTGAAGVSALTPGATIISSGTTLAFEGSFYANGLTLKCTTGSATSISLGNVATNLRQVWDNCTFWMAGAGSSGGFQIGNIASGGGGWVEIKDCTFKFGATGQKIAYYGDVFFRGGSVNSGGGAVPNIVFTTGGGTGRGMKTLVEGFDMSACSSTVTLHASGNTGASFKMRDCRVPESWTGTPQTTIVPGHRMECWNLWNSTTTWRVWITDYSYTLKENATVYKTGGYQDDTTPLSWKMDTTANCKGRSSYAQSPEILINNTVTGSAITVNLDILRDSSTNLTDADIWLDIEYISGSTGAMGASIGACSVIGTPSAYSSSPATWVTTGLSTPNKQRLSATFTPGRKGYIICRVCCTVPSTTIYIDPLITVS